MKRDLAQQAPASAALAPWRAVIDAMLDAVWLVDAVTLRVVDANHAAGELLGVPPAALIGRPVAELAATPEDLCFWDEAAQGLADRIESETLVVAADGSTRAVTRRVSPVPGADGATLFVVVLRDRSEQQRVERELEGAVADLRATLESTDDGILVTDLAGRIRNFNRRFASLWQLPEALLERRDDDAVLEAMRREVVDAPAFMRRLAAIDDAPAHPERDQLQLRCGRVLEQVVTAQCQRGRPVGRVYAFRDVTDRLVATQQIETLSYSDVLTGLPNRRLLADRVELALARSRREGTPFALLFLNLDRFTRINDTLGRIVGDRVLRDVADRLRGCVREIDTVARLGGDEFVALVSQTDVRGAEAAAQRMLEALKQPFAQDGLSFTVTASLGIAPCIGDAAGLDELVRRSDAAMREAKQAGGAAFRFHRPRDAGDAGPSRSRMRLDHAMRLALAQQRFRLHYQPQVDFASGAVVGAEALIRWQDAERGEVSPGEFIPAAEESGFIVAIGDWVLQHAVAQAAAWAGAGLAMPVSVNVSALQFRQPGFVEGVARVLREAGLAPAALELELTESILIQDAPEAMRRLQALAALGVRLAIDDFGTGYSSLAYLKRFPIRRLKIDRSFVSGLPAQASDRAIVQAIVQMGRALDMEIVAEGVETEAQRACLHAAGCDQFQGFLFAPALDAAAFEARVAPSASTAPA
ncbi:MAG TPA: EAL domain-containing protein [Burkholderiaceae bacterium]|nr:EAL domain-containing protein [Burkholderiaceae bacterium]